MLLELLNISLMHFLKIQTSMFQVVHYCSNSVNCRLDSLTAQCKEKGKCKKTNKQTNCFLIEIKTTINHKLVLFFQKSECWEESILIGDIAETKHH